MDLDASLKNHGSRISEIESFVAHIKGMMSGADENVARASDQLDGLLAFKASFEKALPDLEKAIKDVAVVVDDVGKIKSDLAPALAWIAAFQKSIGEASTEPPSHEPPAPEAEHAETEQPSA